MGLPAGAALCQWCLLESRLSIAIVVKLAAHSQGGLAVRITGLAGQSMEMRLSMEQVEATGLMALVMLAVVGADTGDWPESLPLRPANDLSLIHI